MAIIPRLEAPLGIVAILVACGSPAHLHCGSGAQSTSIRWSSVVVAVDTACATDVQGNVICWNRPGTARAQHDPIQCPSAENLPGRVARLSVGGTQLAGLNAEGRLMELGLPPAVGDGLGEPNGGATYTPDWYPVSDNGLIFSDLASSVAGMCGLTSSRDLRCFGQDDLFGGQAGVMGVGLGRSHRCLFYSDGALRCRGNYEPALLLPSTQDMTWGPVWRLDSPVRQLDSADYHSCAVTDSGALWCWGNNWHGQLGSQTPGQFDAPHLILSPARVQVPGPVSKVATGPSYTCAIVGNGNVYCWGFDENGALGVSPDSPFLPQERESALAPKIVPFVSGAVDISAGGSVCSPYICAADRSGQLICWGAANTSAGSSPFVHYNINLQDKSQTSHGVVLGGTSQDYACTDKRRTVPFCRNDTPKGIQVQSGGTDLKRLLGKRTTLSGRFLSRCGGEIAKGPIPKCLDAYQSLQGGPFLKSRSIECDEINVDRCNLRLGADVTASGVLVRTSTPPAPTVDADTTPATLVVDWLCEWPASGN